MIISGKINTANDVYIVTLSGDLTDGAYNDLRSYIGDLLGQGKKKIVLDMAEVGDVDVDGFTEIFLLLESCRRQDAVLKFVQFPAKARARDVERVDLLATFDDEQGAVDSFD